MKKLFTFLMIALVAFSVSAEDYNLYICGVQVTSENAQNLTQILTEKGYLKSGTVSFDDGYKLTLNNAVISSPKDIIYINHNGGDYKAVNSLNIWVMGECSLETDASNSNLSCISSVGSVKTYQSYLFSGLGKLTMTSGNIAFMTYYKDWVSYTVAGPDVTINGGNYGIYSTSVYSVEYDMAAGSLTVDGSQLAIWHFFNFEEGQLGKMDLNNGMEILEPEGGHLVFNPATGVTIQDGNNVSAKHVKIGVRNYDLSVGGVQVTSQNRDDILGDGKVVYNPEDNTLTLDNATITAERCVISNIPGLKILVQGEVTITSTRHGSSGILFNNSDDAVIEGVSSQGEYAKLNINVPDGNYVTPAIYFISKYGGDEHRAFIKNIDINMAGNAYISSENWDEALTVKNSSIISNNDYSYFSVMSDVQLDGCYVALPEGGYFENGSLLNASGNQHCGAFQILRLQNIVGDVNCDGSINAADVTALYNYILNGDETYLSTSDVNNDGAVNAGDVTAVYNIILGNNITQ